jgi:hypothetical protein
MRRESIQGVVDSHYIVLFIIVEVSYGEQALSYTHSTDGVFQTHVNLVQVYGNIKNYLAYSPWAWSRTTLCEKRLCCKYLLMAIAAVIAFLRSEPMRGYRKVIQSDK